MPDRASLYARVRDRPMTGLRALPRLRLEPKPSMLLAGLLIAFHVAAGVTLAVALPGKLLALSAGLPLLLHGAWSVYRHALLRGSRSLVWLEFSDDDRCVAGQRDGEMLWCRVAGDSYVTPALIVLHLAPATHASRRFVVLLPDSSSAQALRRLRARLRWSYSSDRSGSATPASL